MKAMGYAQKIVTDISVNGTTGIKYTTVTSGTQNSNNTVDLSGLYVSRATRDGSGNIITSTYAKKSDLFIHHIRFMITRRGTTMAEVYLNHITNRKEKFNNYDQLFLDMLQHRVNTSDYLERIIASGLVNDNGESKNIIYFSARNSSTITISYIHHPYIYGMDFDIGNEYDVTGFYEYFVSYLYAF